MTELIPSWAEAYCFECRGIREMTAILGRRQASRASGAPTIAVQLSCGHERHAEERVVMSEDNFVLLRARFLRRAAGALTMSG